MPWSGSAPKEPKIAPKLTPGYHRVRLTKVVELNSGDWLAILSNSKGEVAEFIPEDIRPRTKQEREETKARGEKASSDWRFWRLVGAFDYPNPDHWEQDPHPQKNWDAGPDLRAVMASGKEAWIEVGTWNDRGELKPSVEDAKSIVRHAAWIGERDPGTDGSMAKATPPPPAPVDDGTDQEVPF